MRIFLRLRILHQVKQGVCGQRLEHMRSGSQPASHHTLLKGAGAASCAACPTCQPAPLPQSHTHFSRMASRSVRFCTASRRRSCSAWLCGASSKGMSTGFLWELTGGRWERGQRVSERGRGLAKQGAPRLHNQIHQPPHNLQHTCHSTPWYAPSGMQTLPHPGPLLVLRSCAAVTRTPASLTRHHGGVGVSAVEHDAHVGRLSPQRDQDLGAAAKDGGDLQGAGAAAGRPGAEMMSG